MFYQQAFDFSGFCQISCFSGKKTFGIFVAEICVKRYEFEVGMATRCRCCRFVYYKILSLLWKNALAILRVKKKNVRTVSTIVEHSYYVKNKLLGYTFPNISKKVSLYLPPQFHHKFREGYCGQSRFDSWQFFLHQKMLYKML